MYKVGDYVVRNVTGVCKIESIQPLDVNWGDKNRLYSDFGIQPVVLSGRMSCRLQGRAITVHINCYTFVTFLREK